MYLESYRIIGDIVDVPDISLVPVWNDCDRSGLIVQYNAFGQLAIHERQAKMAGRGLLSTIVLVSTLHFANLQRSCQEASRSESQVTVLIPGAVTSMVTASRI